MTPDEVTRAVDELEELELPVPGTDLLESRNWLTILKPEWGNWSSFRWPMFGVLSAYMSKDEYCESLRFLWTHSEGDMNDAEFEVVFRSYGRLKLSPRDLMTDAEKAQFDKWPEHIHIYRGCNKHTKLGKSWTLREAVATHFARERGAKEADDGVSLLLFGSCSKHDILCYINNDMHEEEVLIDPSHVQISSEVEVRSPQP